MDADINPRQSARRRPIRLASFDYATPGAYFCTVVTRDRELLFGQVRGEAMHLDLAGYAVTDAWGALPARFSSVVLDAFVVMPNHVHLVLSLKNVEERGRPTTLAHVIRAFKSMSAIAVNRILERTGPVWQRSYFERVVRNEPELEAIRRYVIENPLQWAIDHENPERD